MTLAGARGDTAQQMTKRPAFRRAARSGAPDLRRVGNRTECHPEEEQDTAQRCQLVMAQKGYPFLSE